MATTSMDYEAANGDRYDGSFFLDTSRRSQQDEALTDVRNTDEAPRYERDNRSASPRPARDDGDSGRRRSASPSGNGDRDRDRGTKDETGSRGGDDDGAINPGSNLFVTGIHPRLTEQEVTRMFEKYGDVEKCQIMRDPHTKESRGFGFVKMVTSDQADAAKEGLQGEQIEGRTLSIEKARRARPRTPTPGKYFGPPKREGRGGSGGGRFNDRYDDRRRGGYGGGGGGYGGGGYGGGRDDPYRYRGYDRRGGYEDRGGGYDRGYREDRGYDRSYREDRGGGSAGGYERRERGGDDSYSSGGRVDRYGGGRDDRGDRYARGGDDRRGGGAAGYERRERGGDDTYTGGRDGPRSRDAPASGAAYADPPARSEGREAYGGWNP
ncbi:RNA-binding domain-containing protein [Colletotrichum sublineola]|uniref:Putative RNA recognition domain-containing protein n=1 Tax=Colletotrichum sublineola TaxID=1173701 RepID=A0A066XU32_COLSU|nr:RNA-binding domain-containing protein [Colletotrichum sublineola]KDN69490.1 putative RNA recognition domain-containing protein [Colletotrichum sublineola]